MAISNAYPTGIPVADADLFVGTKAYTNRTVNYTAQGIADYLNINAKVSIGGQMSFRFSITPDISKTISFEGGLGNNTPFADITRLVTSGSDASGSDITIFLNYLIDTQILLAQQNQPNNFGHYKIMGYSQIGITDFYNLDLEYIGGNGNIVDDTYYDLVSFNLSGGVGTTPNLQQVTTEGNETTTDIIKRIGDWTLQLTDDGSGIPMILMNSDIYGPKGVYVPWGMQISSVIEPGINCQMEILAERSDFIGLRVNNEDIVNVGNNLLTTLTFPTTSTINQILVQRDFTFPDKPDGAYILATTDDIGTTPTLQQVTDEGNITTQDIISYSIIAAIDEIDNSIGAILDSDGSLALSSNGQTGTLRSSNISAAVDLEFPNTAGTNTIPVSVNGNFADVNGEITITGTGTVTSVDLTMPSAFSVSGNPITTAGTLAVTGAGLTSQYIRGDGTLANFPSSTGGGASTSYYLNGSVSQGTIGGVAYKEMNGTPVIGTGTDFTINADGYIAQFITDVGDPNKLLIPAGNWNFETYFSASSNGGSPRFYIELYKYNGATFTLISSSSATPENITGGANIDLYFTALAVPATTLLATDRLAVRFYVIHSGRTITMHTENSHLSQIITTFSTGLTSLNGLSLSTQYFAVGTSGTDFAISSASDTHTFNLPTASASNRGLLSSANWTTFNDKQNALGFTAENVANKSTDVNTDQASSTKYPTVKSVYDWAIGLFATITQVNLRTRELLQDFTDYTTTGVLTEQIISNQAITANDMKINSWLNFISTFSRTGTTNATVAIYLNTTSNSLSGAVKIATATITSTQSLPCFKRDYSINASSVLRGVLFTANAVTDEIATQAQSTTTLTLGSTYYLISTATLNNVADTVTQRAINLKSSK